MGEVAAGLISTKAAGRRRRAPERVNKNETARCSIYCRLSSVVGDGAFGGLIQTAVG